MDGQTVDGKKKLVRTAAMSRKKVRGRVDWKAVSTRRDTFFLDNKGEAGGGIS